VQSGGEKALTIGAEMIKLFGWLSSTKYKAGKLALRPRFLVFIRLLRDSHVGKTRAQRCFVSAVLKY
jgi:hypothetical protein